jgi:hypothetical protein
LNGSYVVRASTVADTPDGGEATAIVTLPMRSTVVVSARTVSGILNRIVLLLLGVIRV